MPSATARELQAIAGKLGFSRTRQTGSHERWNHPDGRAVTIPLHGGREMAPLYFSRSCGSLEFLWMNSVSFFESDFNFGGTVLSGHLENLTG